MIIQITFVCTAVTHFIHFLSFPITLPALCLLQTTRRSIVCQAEGALMESESINMEGSVEVTLAPN